VRKWIVSRFVTFCVTGRDVTLKKDHGDCPPPLVPYSRLTFRSEATNADAVVCNQVWAERLYEPGEYGVIGRMVF
jgi:hypothetical protein